MQKRIIMQAYMQGAAITPSDTVGYPEAAGIYIGGTGNVVLLDAIGTVLTFNGVPAGTILPIKNARVNATSTTATGLIALYYDPAVSV